MKTELVPDHVGNLYEAYVVEVDGIIVRVDKLLADSHRFGCADFVAREVAQAKREYRV